TRMKGLIFLVVHLAVSSALSVKTVRVHLLLYFIAINDRDILWTSPVPYVLGKDLEMNAKGVILKAHDQFRLKSCIDFKPRDSEEYYISVKKLNGCFSYIGQVFNNGQNLSIGTNCDEISTVEHEFLHALGFYHEQSRYDRDDYLTIAFENIKEGRENNFRKVSEEESTTNGVQYDYWSVMHYGKNAFSNGKGSTMITKDPKFEDVIGQRLEVSPSDVLELNRLYKCSNLTYLLIGTNTLWKILQCKSIDMSYILHLKVCHKTLILANNILGQDDGYFMHASTASGQKGDSAWLETHRMTAKRECHIQCLQFYFYHRTLRLMEQITGNVKLHHKTLPAGPPTSHWQVKHVSLNATKHFQVEFEIRKGAGNSSGGFSIDDINLSETECPHVTMQINDFENVLNTSEYGTTLYSQRQYSSGGYAYAVGTVLFNTHFGLFVQLLSGKYDDKLEWPLPQRQVTFQMLDQNPNIQLQMSKQRSITSDLSVSENDTFLWDNPREIGTPYVDENNETIYAGPLIGRTFFATAEELKVRDFLKGGIFLYNTFFFFLDLTPLVNGSALPCPKVGPGKVTSPKDVDKGPCSSQ
uniref:Metalloendopeptidase n=1 Tax=Dicentrarchus labrax TaxID=13489 RepID=A0A8C4HX86_DICLA